MSRTRFPIEIATLVFNRPHLIEPSKARTILTVLSDRYGTPMAFADDCDAEEGPPHFAAGVLSDGLRQSFERHGEVPYALVEGIAIVPIEGTLIHKGKWVGMSSGQTSYEGIRTSIEMALGDSRVTGICLEVDSYGGTVPGCFDLAADIRAAREIKPVWAILSEFAYSAAYALASQADQIVMPETGGVGSIGVITAHVDFSQALEAAGINVTLIHSGPHKADGNPYEPLPDDVRAEIQAECDDMRTRFARLVADGRGQRFTSNQAMATESRIFAVHDDPVRLGLVDAIASPHEALEAFIAETRAPSRRDGSQPAGRSAAAAQPGETSMANSLLDRFRANRAARDDDDDDETERDAENAEDAGAEEGDGADGESSDAAETDADASDTEAAADDDDDDDDDDGDRDDDDDDDKENEDAKASAASALKVAKSIMSLKEAKGRDELAQELAFSGRYSVVEAKKLLSKAPRGDVGNALDRRMRGVPNAGPGGSKADTASGLMAAVARRKGGKAAAR